MRNRIYVNLGFFVLLGIAMTVWAFSTIIRLDAVERPYRVSAEFVSSPGLIRGFDVAYLGVRVGKIGEVRLAPGKIIVGLDIDREIRLPKGVTAEVRRRSAIGEPYVALSPPPTGVAGPALAPGDTIPLARTTVPLDYKKLFEGVGKLLNAVPPEDADTIVHELAVALDGRAPAIRRIIDDAHTLTGTLADNAAVLDDLAVQLTRLTHTLAGRRGALASGITDLRTVTAALRESRTDLNAILDQGPGVFAQLDAAIRTSRPGFSCLLTAAGLPHQPAFSAATERNVHHLLSIMPTALSLAGDISERRGGTVYGKASFIFSVPGGPTPAEEYAGPLGPPAIPKLRSCPARSPAPAPDFTADRGHTSADDADASPAAERPSEQASPEPSSDSSTTPSPKGVAATRPAPPMNVVPLIAAIFLAVVVSGGIVGWIAAGRAARRREES
ncbi:virulence factor Mce family protein [[Actinomadura] parvosata subsp. kistnae]|uniref:Organic solvent ABC transporter substrate-binding protein n=1 Tax=[Actinomadura] parvosata subsp. kistnae TaxID=1909395 RepID=A0A1V0A3B6_9ACTN|nr:MCE family protein [Nonomuraea sp. ATCC 55076]AQZ64687.1 organic solvent ABC transporter substrate-bindng protein [Nonomuraea sp. ATCC 55076]SPL98580.1 virulence factor Mce family protein [Actinomadura parvosata subsp. kistnae]